MKVTAVSSHRRAGVSFHPYTDAVQINVTRLELLDARQNFSVDIGDERGELLRVNKLELK